MHDVFYYQKTTSIDIRLAFLNIELNRFAIRKKKLIEKAGLDEHTVLFVSGLNNDIEFTHILKGFAFTFRELFELFIMAFHSFTKSLSPTTAKKFNKFSKKIMAGDYDCLGLRSINILKNSFHIWFMMRVIRNEMKNDLSRITFRIVTRNITSQLNFMHDHGVDESLLKYFGEDNYKKIKEDGMNIQIEVEKYISDAIIFVNAMLNEMNADGILNKEPEEDKVPHIPF